MSIKFNQIYINIYIMFNQIYIYIYIYIYICFDQWLNFQKKKKTITSNTDKVYTVSNSNIRFFSKETIIWRLQVQSSLQASNNTGILNTCTRLWLTKPEQATPVVSRKDVVRSSVKVPEFDKHLKKAGGHIGRNVVEIAIKMKTIVRKPLMIKINKLRLRNLDN